MKSVAVSSAKMIRDVILVEATKALQEPSSSVGALKFSEMVKMVQAASGVSVSRAKVVADTCAQAMWHRVALEKQYDEIEAGIGKKLQYVYTGPKDERSRPFCAGLRGYWSVTECFVTCGGYLCRHQWDVAPVL